MGLHGSATCVMRFDDATDWLIGEAGKGLAAMFVMMNAARLHVGLQGIGLLDAAWQKADAYARERRQMRAPDSGKSGSRGAYAADCIIAHPAIQRILDTQRAWIDGGRVPAYRTAVELDIARHHPDAARREAAQGWCALVTPVLKAAFTDQAFHGGSDCLQVFGGHGYVSEWCIEQILLDARITMIYEGTNEIQAIDLLVRKVLGDQGLALGKLLGDLCMDLENGEDEASGCGTTNRVALMARDLRAATSALLEDARTSTEHVYWVAGDYLRAVALVLLAWAWARIDRANPGLHERWTRPAAALRAWVLPEFEMRLKVLSLGPAL